MATTERGKTVIVWLIVFTILVTLSMIGRFWARRIQRRKLSLDDFFVVFAFLNLIGLEIPTFMSYHHNLGAHAVDLTYEDSTFQHKAQYSASFTWTFATCFAKLAVLWMYLTIFPGRRLKWAVYVTMGLSVAFLIAFVPIFMTVCLPVSAQWSPDIMFTLAHCRAIQTQEFASVGANMALDLIIVMIPIPSVWSLQMSVAKKVFVTSMFSLGLAVVGIGAWRINTTIKSTKSVDWSWFVVPVGLQSHLELWLGIIAANLPQMSPLLTRLLLPAMSSFYKSITSSRYTLSRTGGQKDTSGSTDDSRGGKSSRRRFTQISDERTELESMEVPLGTIERRHETDIESGQHDSQEFPKSKIWREIEVSINHE
ncbi:hypothetical protein EAE96_002795 [Botrytis aclada]|nr:hypothetical protein EAE96_002795 [Botrytis aclada]